MSLLLSAMLSLALAGPGPLLDLAVPGPARFGKVARDVIDVRIAMSPDIASNAGLFEESAVVPSYKPEVVAALQGRLEADLRAMLAMKTSKWPIDQQVDLRWIYATALEGRRRLAVERAFEHRPAEWLEPVANDYLALFTYAPERADLRARITAQLPTMLQELYAVQPTARDVKVAQGLVDSLSSMVALDAPGADRDAALAALTAYKAHLDAATPTVDFVVIGEENYAWRLKHALMLPWTPDELLALANAELALVDAELAALEPELEPEPTLSDDGRATAAGLDQQGLLGLYDGLVREFSKRLAEAGVITVPPQVGPIQARPTPEALIPLTGDGGSMNPPPTFGSSNIGYWNVEHVKADWSQDDKEDTARTFAFAETNGLGPYAVHEGVPGHHTQLSIARLNPDPLRSVLWDNVMIEGWALYAEQLFWEAGGFGDSKRAHYTMLRSWRFRIRRVIYDINVETGRWTLQQAADFKYGVEPGQGQIDPDVQRAINWPTQLICYFSGKMQILALREQMLAKPGGTLLSFHDALLAQGSIPVALSAAALNGAPLPPLEKPEQW